MIGGRYAIVREARGTPVGIQCGECLSVSFNENDVRNKYCGYCHQFLTVAAPLVPDRYDGTVKRFSVMAAGIGCSRVEKRWERTTGERLKSFGDVFEIGSKRYEFHSSSTDGETQWITVIPEGSLGGGRAEPLTIPTLCVGEGR